jgi:hypothetical protein
LLLTSCFGITDFEAVISDASSQIIGQSASISALASLTSNAAAQTATLDKLISSMTLLRASTTLETSTPLSLAICVRFSNENLLCAALGCKAVLAREAAAAASSAEVSAGTRAAVEAELSQLKERILEQQSQLKHHEEQLHASTTLHQVLMWHLCYDYDSTIVAISVFYMMTGPVSAAAGAESATATAEPRTSKAVAAAAKVAAAAAAAATAQTRSQAKAI